MDQIVSNASPLILLSMVGEFTSLEALFGELWIAPEVRDEVVVRGKGKPGAREVAEAGFIRVEPVAHPGRVQEIQARYQLGLGECATIALATQTDARIVLIDDKEAREAAKVEGLRVAGTLRVLEMCYERKLVVDLPAVYRKLHHSGARIAPRLLEESLSRFGFSSPGEPQENP